MGNNIIAIGGLKGSIALDLFLGFTMKLKLYLTISLRCSYTFFHVQNLCNVFLVLGQGDLLQN